MEIQWFPGHMAKTKRLIKENIKLVDLVIELLDARIPYSSSNPDLNEITGDRERIIVLNKSDLADPVITQMWKRYFRDRGMTAVEVNSIKGEGIDMLLKEVTGVSRNIRDRWRERGRRLKPIRAMIVGIPNVGKSSLINRLAGRSAARTGEKPGITRGKQWIRVSREIMLLDTPGVLWPKFGDERVGLNLAFAGSIKEEILDREELGIRLIERLADIDAELFSREYGIEDRELAPHEVLEQIAFKRGCLMGGNKVDILRASGIIMEDFRSGKLGRISLEVPCAAP